MKEAEFVILNFIVKGLTKSFIYYSELKYLIIYLFIYFYLLIFYLFIFLVQRHLARH